MRRFITQTASALTLAVTLLCGPAGATAGQAQGRLYTTDDLLDQAAFGRATIDPTDRWILFEKQAPYSAVRRYDYGLFRGASTSVLWIADALSGAPATPLLPPSEGAGHMLGDWSPSGRKLLIYRLQDEAWRLGVFDLASRSVEWLDVRPEAGGYGRVVQWRSDDQLVLIDRRETTLPFVIGWDTDAMDLTRRRWALQASGAAPSLTVMGSGAFQADTPVSPVSDLVQLDLKSGRKTVLSTGRFFDLELSPDGGQLAAMTLGEMPPVDPDRPLWPVDKPERRHVQIIDLARGTIATPCDGCAVAPFLMGWSADSRRLLVWMTGPNGPASGELAALRPDGQVETFDRAGLEPDVGATSVASFTAVRAVWQGDRPVLRARRGTQGRYDWHRLGREAPVNLTGTLTTAPSRIDAVDHNDLLAIADGAAWRLTPAGQARRETALGELRPFAPFDVLDAPRLALNTPRRGASVLAVRHRGRLTPVHAGWRTPIVDDATLLVTPLAGSDRQVVEETERNGVRSLVLRRSHGEQRTLATLNTHLADVRFAQPLAVAHSGPDGGPLTSWLYLPTKAVSGRIPLVVLTYPGRPSRPQTDPAEFNTELNLQLLTAAGYAVLTPSVPKPFYPDEPAKGLADQVLAVVDATLAQHPELDGDRLVYWGQSFGGYSGLVVATQTRRFKSIIVAASVSNLAEKWGEFAPWNRADPRWGISMRHGAGWTETSQGGMGGPPWSDPDRYVRNSPLFQAGAIETPILIMHGERDMGLGQAESLFSALWRQNKDARFITWWGEGHTVDSAANLREMYRQIFVWLNDTGVGPADAPTAQTAPPTAEASSPAGPPT